MKSNVYFFAAKTGVDILSAICKDENNVFICFGTGAKAFRSAMKTAKPNEVVYQIKIPVTGTPEVLYQY